MECPKPPGGMPKFTLVMLSRKETETLGNTLATYDKAGLLEAVDEVILFLNERHPDTEALVEKYKQTKFNFRVC